MPIPAKFVRYATTPVNPDYFVREFIGGGGDQGDNRFHSYDRTLCPECGSRVINQDDKGYVFFCHRCGYQGPENAARHVANKPGYILVVYPWHAPGALMKEALEEQTLGHNPEL